MSGFHGKLLLVSEEEGTAGSRRCNQSAAVGTLGDQRPYLTASQAQNFPAKLKREHRKGTLCTRTTLEDGPPRRLEHL